MQLLPIVTPLLREGSDLVELIAPHVRHGDIVAVSSKAVATVEGARVALKGRSVTAEALHWAEASGLPAEFCQAIVEETSRLRGGIVRGVNGALLTRLSPAGMHGTLLVPNAGLDRSNIEEGFCIGWPRDPVASVRRLKAALGNVGIVLTDSCVRPGRRGVTALALATSGLAPVRSEIGTKDLFNKPLTVTEEAVADQIATAANLVMGNAAQSVPAAILRDHGIALSDDEGWVPGMAPREDLFDVA